MVMKGQSFDSYLTELRNLCNDCELGDLTNSLLTDMLIIGLSNKKIQERFLRKDNISLGDVIRNCKTEEITSIQAKCIQKGISNADNVSIDYVNDRVDDLFES